MSDRQTDRQTLLITILRHRPRGRSNEGDKTVSRTAQDGAKTGPLALATV